jgi:hypothetical protein
VIRSVAFAAALAAALAAGVYMLPRSVLEDRLAPLLRVADRPEEPDEWPICTTMSSVAEDVRPKSATVLIELYDRALAALAPWLRQLFSAQTLRWAHLV